MEFGRYAGKGFRCIRGYFPIINVAKTSQCLWPSLFYYSSFITPKPPLHTTCSLPQLSDNVIRSSSPSTITPASTPPRLPHSVEENDNPRPAFYESGVYTPSLQRMTTFLKKRRHSSG